MIITKEILDEMVPVEMIPTRLDSAMNLYTYVGYRGNTGIILYNINPDTWNCLYPFYELNHKFTIDSYKFDNKNLTYRKLIEQYQAIYKKVYENEYSKNLRRKTLIDEYKKTFNLDNIEINDELPPIYELKYSKTKNVWTIYYFENYVASSIEPLDNLLNQRLYVQKILPLNSPINEIDGTPIVTNISYLLSNKANREKLRNNLIEREE